MKAASSLATWSAMALATTGASLVLAIVMSKVVDTAALALSVAVTLTVSRPTSSLAGVPEKVRVEGLKPSQDGSGLPLASVAV